MLVTTFLTLFLNVFSLQGKDASKLAGNWFQLLMVLLMYRTKRNFQLCIFRNSANFHICPIHIHYQSLDVIYDMKIKNLLFLSDTRSDDWFLMNSVWTPLTLIALYLYFIFNLGPRLMKNRPPMQLDTVIKAYDIMQVILNCFLTERVSNSDMYS